MNKVSKIIIAVSTAVFASSQTRALSQARERSEISAEHKWKLEDLYSTSFTASTALAEKVLGKEKGAVEKYLEFLAAGGSDYPIDLLKKAGVDMISAEPFDKTMEAMNRTIDEIEAILDKKDR